MIEVRCCTFAYASSPSVFEDLDFTAPAGAITAVTGPSGRGKSTLLYVIGLMLRPQRGQILLGGRRIDELSDTARSRLRGRKFGFVFQDAALDSTRSVQDNVVESTVYNGLSRKPALVRARQMLIDLGVDVDPSRRPGQLSGGQAQRVALCRALIHEPRVVLADEPTGNLDETSSNAVLGSLRHAADRGAAVVIATHDPRVLDRSDGRLHLG